MTSAIKFFKQFLLALSIAALALAPAVAGAQDFSGGNTPPTYSGGNTAPTYSGGNSVGGLSNPLGKITGICSLLKALFNVLFLFMVPFAMLYMVYAGLMLVAARGNPEALKKARLNLYWTIIGIGVLLGAWFFVQLLANTLGALGVEILGDCR